MKVFEPDDDVVVSVTPGDGLDPGDVTASVGLADAEGRDLVAPDRWFEELRLLLSRAEVVDDGRRHVGLDEQPHPDAAHQTAR